jgi:phosphopantothenoylcysteine decarboxylase/phosphopantothenate--cysteine ligase
MRTIKCADRSGGRLIFAVGCLKALAESDLQVDYYFDKETKNKYQTLFKFIPSAETEPNDKNTVLLIFTDLQHIEDSLKTQNALILPILFQEELDRYKQIVKNFNHSKQIIPVALKDGVYLSEKEWIADFIKKKYENDKPLDQKKVLISAGPTVEDIDPVRYLTNRSTGKMGIALARAAFVLGADVELIIGPTAEKLPEYIDITKIRSAEDMAKIIIQKFINCDIYLGSAAVADFTPAQYASQKIKKADGLLELPLKHTRDILAELSALKENQIVVGFSVETNDEIENSKIKLEKKNLDMIVINNPMEKGAAFAEDTNLVTILKRNGQQIKLPLLTKYEVGIKIFESISKH